MRNRILSVLTLSLTALLSSGCVEVTEHLVINADGSGTVKIETTVHLDAGTVRMLERGRGISRVPVDPAPYPPISRAWAQELFQGKDLDVKFRTEPAEAGSHKTVVEVAFKDVNALLETPWAKVHSLWMKRDAVAGTFTLRAKSGMDVLALTGGRDRAAYYGPTMVALAEAAEKDAGKMRVDFSVTLPAAVKADAAVVTDRTAAWSLKRAETEDASAWAEALRRTMTVSCPARAVTFTPKPPARLDLLPFAELAEGVAVEAARVDAKKVLAATQFYPVAYRVTRIFDLAGQGGVRGNEAALEAVVVVPRALAPVNWDDFVLSDVRDDKGNALIPKRERYRYSSFRSRWDEFDDDDSQPAKDALVRHNLTVQTKVPPPSAKTFRVFKGALDMHYRGATHVVKLKNVIAEKTISRREPPKPPKPRPREVVDDGPDWITAGGRLTGRKPSSVITHRRLTEFGVTIAQPQATRIAGTTEVRLKVRSRSGRIEGLQVFDATGRPWPTVMESDKGRMIGVDKGDRTSVTAETLAVVIGEPKGPLSLALIVPARGPAVTFPIALKDLPLTPNKPPAPKRNPFGRLLGGFKRTGRVEKERGKQLPIVDAVDGYKAEGLTVTTTSMRTYAGTAKQIDLKTTGRFESVDIGCTVRATLFAPPERSILSLEGVKLTKAVDDRGREVKASGTRSRYRKVMRTYGTDAKHRSVGFVLELALPQPNAEAIEELTGEAIVVSFARWKTQAIVDPKADPKREIDLTDVLADTKLIIERGSVKTKKGGDRRPSRFDAQFDIKVTGPETIGRLAFDLHLEGVDRDTCYVSRDRTSQSKGKFVRSCRIVFDTWDDVAAPGKATLTVRYPDDLKRERVKFTLEALDLF